jgi:hypothetical protein
MVGSALHAANRHVERWAPETGAERVRSMRSLGFVDRLVSPWIETAQRSAGLRMFSSLQRSGAPERQGAPVSWVFPRPWYQDELDWMAAARQTAQHQQESGESGFPAPAMFTTRGTYVSPASSAMPTIRPTASPSVMPQALYEFVAPSLSIAPPQAQRPQIQGVGFGGSDSNRQQAYSPLVPLAAVQAAELMQRTVAPLSTAGQVSPALRNVLATMLARTTVAQEPSRVSQFAPELVTPPAPRRDDVASSSAQAAPTAQTESNVEADRVADTLHEQRTQIAQLEVVAQRAAQREVDQRRAVEVQQRAQQVEATLRERVARAEAQAPQSSPAAAAPSAPPADRVAAERTRIEERIAQRVAERAAIEQRVAHQQVAQQRLHEQSRAEAAAHVRSEPTPVVAPVISASAAERRAPAEVIAAISALPPELQAMIARSVSTATRPEQAAQAIAHVTEALRAVELMARTTAANQSFEATRGPRVMLPAGLGGLVSTVNHTVTSAQMFAPQATVSPTAAAPRAPRTMLRAPSMTNMFVAPTAQNAAAPASTTALGAASQAKPAALTHLAYADRWLARFAGATPKSLDTFNAAGPSSATTMHFLANAAPDAVFVAPTFDIERTRTQTVGADAQAIAAMPAPIQRFDDSQETPDDVFLAIAAGASRQRAAASPQRPAPEPTVGMPAGERQTLADAVAMHAPSAPDAGLSAQLAASPFAPALRHVLPLPAAAAFDVRSLFGSGLSATYLAGLLASSAQEINLSISERPFEPTIGQTFASAGGMLGERTAPELDLAYVAPTDDRPAITADGESVSEGAAASSSYAAAPSASSPAAAQYEQPLTTLRTALLSWTQDVPASAPMGAAGSASDSPAAPISNSAARVMLDSMSMPMIADTAPTANGAWTAPGMIAERAFGWSLAQERNASDLALDFVTPELVLAARVYGLGPADAAQASRLALAGPGQLTAMAGAVDRTFVQAMAIENERTRLSTAYPTSSGDIATVASSSSSSSSSGAPTAGSPTAASPTYGETRPMPAQTAFGVERRSPRGAFLWPSATVAALGLSAPGPDSEQSMSVAALELLAAQAVAEIGTYAALQPREGLSARGDAGASTDASSPTFATGAAPSSAAPSGAASSSAAAAATPSIGEPAEADVLGAAAALVPASRRARFDALYVALGHSGTGRSWSPAARAARALALAGRGEEQTLSAYERAASAWDVLPVVYATDGFSTEELAEQTRAGVGTSRMSSGMASAASSRAPSGRDVVAVDGRPGLSNLSARAGDALGSYVTPLSMASMGPSSSTTSSREAPIPVSQRAGSAAPELVRTGRPSGRHGGGEAEIPAWFEAAARKMLGERTGNSDGISMAEMTLISTAPKQAVAASSTGNVGAAPTQASVGHGDQAKPGDKDKIDIEEVAAEVYRQVMLMFDAARERNGEPYL